MRGIFFSALIYILLYTCTANSPLKLPETPSTSGKTSQHDTSIDDLSKKMKNALTLQKNKGDEIIQAAALGRGGEYDNLKTILSSKSIECDHAPPSSIFGYIENLKDLPEKIQQIVDRRVELKSLLSQTNYEKNEENIKKAQTDMKGVYTG